MSHCLLAVAIGSVCAVAFVTGAAAPHGQPAASQVDAAPDVRWRRAVDAWEAGQYPDEINELILLMRSPAAGEYLDRVALLSGELFTTVELTTDGRNPRISPSGEYASYETGPTAATVTRVVRVTNGETHQVAEFPGVSAGFDPASVRVVYLRPARAAEWMGAADGDLVVRDLASGGERVVSTGALLKTSPLFAADGRNVLFIGSDPADLGRSDIYLAGDAGAPERLTDQPGHKTNVLVDPGSAALMYTVSAASPFRSSTSPGGRGAGAGGGGLAAGGGGPTAGGGAPPTPNPCGAGGAGGGRGGGAASFGVVDLRARTTRLVNGSAVTMSADGSTIAWLNRAGDLCALDSSPTLGSTVKTIRSAGRLDAPALSPDGKLVAYQIMLPTGTDWEIFVTGPDGVHRRITREIQHDVLPHFLTSDTLLGMIGEQRHRRSYIYDVSTGERTRVFSNNTLRTISPEYVWLPSDDGKRLLIQAERDGDTISVERGVYLTDLTRKVTVGDVVARLQAQLAAETDLRQRMTKAFRPLASLIQRTVANISPTRAYEYGKAQFDFDSKYVSQPGNAKAIDYLNKLYTSFGYTPELQWFQARPQQQGPGFRTANVVSTLKGTENPDLIYVVSSHFDSVAGGPGADDDTSGTCALLETARVLAKTPLPATVVFASFTGEEAGLLGSREFVRLAAERKWHIVGALNNDMIGWAGESARMDNTIRYSNAGIRDVQHGAAFLFTKLVTYDAKYYKSTDAQAFFDGWGDIVGGIGSYPVLGNPNYHQPSDLIETVNFQQVAETAKTTAASIMYLASSPSRLKELKAKRTSKGVDVSWTPSPEVGVRAYVVAYGGTPESKMTRIIVKAAGATLPALPSGAVVSVKAINSGGLEGWDWARTVVQ